MLLEHAVSDNEYRKKSDQLKTQRTSSLRSAVSALWGPKSLDTLVDLDLEFEVETEKTILRRRGISSAR